MKEHELISNPMDLSDKFDWLAAPSQYRFIDRNRRHRNLRTIALQPEVPKKPIPLKQALVKRAKQPMGIGHEGWTLLMYSCDL